MDKSNVELDAIRGSAKNILSQCGGKVCRSWRKVDTQETSHLTALPIVMLGDEPLVVFTNEDGYQAQRWHALPLTRFLVEFEPVKEARAWNAIAA